MMWGRGDSWGSGGTTLMVIVMLAVLALIVAGVILLVRGLARRDQVEPGPPQEPSGTSNRSALQVLEDRYARGEIQREEFLQRKQDLLGGQEAGQ